MSKVINTRKCPKVFSSWTSKKEKRKKKNLKLWLHFYVLSSSSFIVWLKYKSYRVKLISHPSRYRLLKRVAFWLNVSDNLRTNSVETSAVFLLSRFSIHGNFTRSYVGQARYLQRGMLRKKNKRTNKHKQKNQTLVFCFTTLFESRY